MSEINPLMSAIKLPGRIFQLPSRGIFYKNGELADDVKNGEVHVMPMSALAEIHMKNPDQLFSGHAIETVFQECVVGINKPGSLLSKDVDAVMMFLRTVTYGPTYEFTAVHNCEHAKNHSYIADVDTCINETKMIDPTIIESLYKIELPSGQVVRLEPSRYSQVIELLKANEGKEKITVDDMKANLIMMLTSVVVRVDDVTDPKHIKEWLSKIPSPWVNRIAEKIESINDWGPVMRWSGKCRDCNEEFEIELPINPVSFFTE